MVRHPSGLSNLNDLIWYPNRWMIGKISNKKYMRLNFKRYPPIIKLRMNIK